MHYGKKHDLPFGIMDVAGLLRLNIRRRAPGQVYVDCPICGDRRGKMNLNTEKDLWRCNYCGEGGGMLSLYAKVYGVSNSDAYREICDALAVNGFSPDYTVPEKTTPAEAEQSDAASVQEVHQTLSMLLSMLTLIPAHREHLRSVRGLSDDEITRFGFKSTPPSFLCRSLTNRLVKAGCRVQGVPGFYVDDNGCWTVKFHQRTSGIIIPIFGVDGLIRGAQIRLDHPLKDKDDPPEKTGVKYLTLSSAGKRMGTTSGSPIHFVGDPCSRVVYVTEGCLKADVAHALMHRTFVATLGANNTAKLDELFAFLHRNGTEEIIEAEDMDKYSNAVGKCPRCRHKITFKAKGKITEYLRSPTECAYLAQKCGDGFVVRQFHVNRQYRKEENTITSKTSSFEKQRIFYREDLSSHSYHWGWYKQRRTRWVEGIDEYINTGMGYSYNEYCYQPGSIYGKTLSSIAPLLARTGLREYVRLCRGCVSPNWYLFAWGRFPRVEQICKANLPRLTMECLEDFGAVKSCIRQESETSLVKALALDTHRLSRLRTLNGGAIMLDWLQREKCSGRIIPDHALRWLEQEKIHVSDIAFILDRMSEQQVCNYLQRQKSGTRDSLRQIIFTWRDYLSMADKLGINTHDEIVYRVKLLRQRHDELVEQLRKRERDMEAAATARKYRKIAGICRLIKPKYEYTGEVYSIVVPSGVRDIMREGDALSHCVGKSDRYWERIEQQEAYILFLRKTAEIDKPYYTLEVEPNGTIRQKRTYFDRQNDDLKDAEQFLKEWQKVVSERLTESDREKAEKSKVLRLQEFEQLRQDDIRSGRILSIVYLSGNTLSFQYDGDKL